MLVESIEKIKSPDEEKKGECAVGSDQIQINFSNIAMVKFVEHNEKEEVETLEEDESVSENNP